MKRLYFACLLVVALLALPALAHGERVSREHKLQFAAWVPYWKKESSVAGLLPHLSQFAEISPFGYSVAPDGTLIDLAKIEQEPWTTLITESKRQNVKVIPSIMWSNREAIHTTLSVATKRNAHLRKVMAEVLARGYDGIDIDYENKKVESKAGFSQFIKDLSKELHKNKKTLSCTVEARMPPESRFSVIPKEIAYVNDYAVLGVACDTVRIMAYDQMNADIVLNKLKGATSLYAPVADIDWVGKVVSLAVKSIKPSKIVLGIPTYGYEFDTKGVQTGVGHAKIRSHTYKSATDLAASVGASAVRTSGGELSFAYTTATSTRVVTFTDATAISHKLSVAREYKLRGVAFFKIDAENDASIWNLLR